MQGTFGKPEYFDFIEDEYHVCREGVGLIDMSSFAKFNLAGDKYHLIKYLQKMCSNDIDIPVGSIIATGMLNEFGKCAHFLGKCCCSSDMSLLQADTKTIVCLSGRTRTVFS